MLLIRTLRRTPLNLVVRHNIALRTAPIRPFMRAKAQRLLSLRFETTSARPAVSEAASRTTPSPPKHGKAHTYFPVHNYLVCNAHHLLAYGPKLCVYHAGTGRITFLACLKLSTLFIFTFFGFVVTPAYFEKEGLSPTVTRSKSPHLDSFGYVSHHQRSHTCVSNWYDSKLTHTSRSLCHRTVSIRGIHYLAIRHLHPHAPAPLCAAVGGNAPPVYSDPPAAD
jgi:hypothetical protein